MDHMMKRACDYGVVQLACLTKCGAIREQRPCFGSLVAMTMITCRTGPPREQIVGR